MFTFSLILRSISIKIFLMKKYIIVAKKKEMKMKDCVSDVINIAM